MLAKARGDAKLTAQLTWQRLLSMALDASLGML